jgi:hypothetical protein
MKLIVHSTDVFIIFDSHSRPSHPDGAVFILNTSIHATAAHLRDILPVDRRLMSDNDLQWQAQLLANFSGHVLVSNGQIPLPLIQTVTESSLTILALRAEVSDLKLQNSVLTSENKRLEAEMRVENERRSERMKILFSSSGHQGRILSSASGRISNAVPGPSRVTKRHSANQTTHEQREFNEKSGHRHTQKKDRPVKVTRDHFECRICMEKHAEDSVVHIDSCGHRFCRDCIRGYIEFKLGENRFPMLCPMCITEQRKGEPGGV